MMSKMEQNLPLEIQSFHIITSNVCLAFVLSGPGLAHENGLFLVFVGMSFEFPALDSIAMPNVANQHVLSDIFRLVTHVLRWYYRPIEQIGFSKIFWGTSPDPSLFLSCFSSFSRNYLVRRWPQKSISRICEVLQRCWTPQMSLHMSASAIQVVILSTIILALCFIESTKRLGCLFLCIIKLPLLVLGTV